MAYYCLIDHEKRFIACVDPKCGCTTVKDWFEHSRPEPRPEGTRSFARAMIPADSVASHDDYFKIFFVRHPLRRLVSFYYAWVVHDPRHWCFADDARCVTLHDHSFRRFVSALHEIWKRGEQLQHHLTPQTRVLGTVRFDEVVKIEEFDQRIESINRRLQIDYTPRRLNALDYASTARPMAFDLSPDQLRNEPVHPVESFYDERIEALARAIYADDLHYYDAL